MTRYLATLAMVFALAAPAAAQTTIVNPTTSDIPTGSNIIVIPPGFDIGVTDSAWTFSQSPVAADAWDQGSTSGVTTEFSDGCATAPPQSGLQVQGPEAVIDFIGTSVTLYGATGPNAGIGAYAIDGGSLTTVDAYSASDAFPVALVNVSGLPDASHVLTYQVTCDKNASSTGYYQTLAYFTDTHSTERHEPSENSYADGNVTLHGSGWNCGSPTSTGAPEPPNGVPPSGDSTDLSGNHCWDGTSGDSVTFSFTGTCIEVFTRPDIGDGEWDAYIDGTKIGTVDDQYSTVDNDGLTGYADFVDCGLADTTHTFEALVDGTAPYPSESESGSGLKNLLQFDEALSFP